MSMVVKNEVQAYEEAGNEVKGIKYPIIEVRSHWNRDEFIVLNLPSGDSYTVLARDLQKAITNAGNWR